jgi:hypothetical protein
VDTGILDFHLGRGPSQKHEKDQRSEHVWFIHGKFSRTYPETMSSDDNDFKDEVIQQVEELFKKTTMTFFSNIELKSIAFATSHAIRVYPQNITMFIDNRAQYLDLKQELLSILPDSIEIDGGTIAMKRGNRIDFLGSMGGEPDGDAVVISLMENQQFVKEVVYPWISAGSHAAIFRHVK